MYIPGLNNLNVAVYTTIYTMYDITGMSAAYSSTLLHIVNKSVKLDGGTYGWNLDVVKTSVKAAFKAVCGLYLTGLY